MPLSEDDQRRLEQIERALTRDDPGFADRIGAAIWRRRRQLITSLVVFALGMVVLMTGLVTTDAWLVVGVLVSVTGAASMAITAVLVLRRPFPVHRHHSDHTANLHLNPDAAQPEERGPVRPLIAVYVATSGSPEVGPAGSRTAARTRSRWRRLSPRRVAFHAAALVRR